MLPFRIPPSLKEGLEEVEGHRKKGIQTESPCMYDEERAFSFRLKSCSVIGPDVSGESDI